MTNAIPPNCKGDWSLRTECGTCPQCIASAPLEIARLRNELDAKSWVNVEELTLARASWDRITKKIDARSLLYRDSQLAIKFYYAVGSEREISPEFTPRNARALLIKAMDDEIEEMLTALELLGIRARHTGLIKAWKESQ